MIKGIYVLNTEAYHKIYGSAERHEIERLVHIYAPQQTKESVKANRSILAEADVIFSGWGMPVMDEDFLAAAPSLKCVFYGAGSIREIVTESFWGHGIVITSAYAANAVPVAEYALSQILFCLKRGWHYALSIKRERRYPPSEPAPGAYGSIVGVISLGTVGRHLIQLLQQFEVKTIAHDPYVTSDDAVRLHVELCSLEDLFRRSDVVSLHAPLLKKTEGMITGAHFASMKPNASFINTARGAIVREQEMAQILRQRPDLQVVLDVTHPEPPEPSSPLYALPNVVLTPHIAGSTDRECLRMGRFMVDELRRYVAGEPLRWAISQEKSVILA
jgi:phosphoglycerate dehydrogenase-like enzyme